MKCLGILWNGMQDFKTEALGNIKEYASIIDIIDINLNEKYENFVRDIYSLDDIATWKVDKKIETMFQCSDNRIISVVIMNIDVKEQYFHELKKRMVFTNLENMKTEIRRIYSKKVNCYFFDNVFHVTDNEKEFYDDLNVVIQYINEIENNLSENKIKILKKVYGNENRDTNN